METSSCLGKRKCPPEEMKSAVKHPKPEQQANGTNIGKVILKEGGCATRSKSRSAMTLRSKSSRNRAEPEEQANGTLNTIEVFAEVLLQDVEICRRVVLDKKWCKDQTLDLPTLVFYKTFP